MKTSTYLIIASFFVASSHMAFPYDSLADEIKLEAQESNAIKVNLEKLIGKKVTVRVTAGEELSGTVQAVGNDAVTLSQLSGKEFYDAAIALNHIVALIVRTH